MLVIFLEAMVKKVRLIFTYMKNFFISRVPGMVLVPGRPYT